jgi:hypothetical protein
MVPRGEVGLIFAGTGLAAGVIAEDLYSALVVVVMTLLAERVLCVDCLARTASVTRERADELVRSIASTVNVSSEAGRCGLCTATRVLFRIR